MKKIVTILLTSLFLMSAANAGGMIGIKAGVGSLSGERTEDASHGVANNEATVDSEYAAIFAEVEAGSMVSLGLEIVPLEAKIDTKASTTTDSTATIENFKTLYALVPVGSNGIYGKVGYSHADLSVKANYDTVTVNSSSDTLEGPMVGIGVQFDNPLPLLDILRIEGNYHKFDELKITTTNTNGTGQTTAKKGEADLMTLSISLAKSF